MFSDASAVQRHLQNDHAAVGEIGHQCSLCASVFRDPTYLPKHEAKCASRRQKAERQLQRQAAMQIARHDQQQSAKSVRAVDSLEPTTASRSSQQSAAEGGQRHDRQVGADHDASGAAAVPVLPPIDPAILRELAAQPQPPDSDVQMDEQGARADVSHGRSNRIGATPSSAATGAAGCDGGGRGAESAGAVKCPRCSERFASQPHTLKCESLDGCGRLMGVAQPISSVHSFFAVVVTELDDLNRHAKAHELQRGAGFSCKHCPGVFRARSTFDMHVQRCSARTTPGSQSDGAGAASGQQRLANEIATRGAKQSAGGADPKQPPVERQLQSAEQQSAPSSSGGAALAAAGVQGRLAAQPVAQFSTGDSSSRVAFIKAFWAALPADFRQMVSTTVVSLEHAEILGVLSGGDSRCSFLIISL
jgi:hypothetical protein